MNFSLANFSKRDARDAARLAIQSAVAAAFLFVIMQAIGLPEKFVGVLSAVLIVQPSIGSTLGEAFDRFLAALAGSVIGIICLIILPAGYGTAVALAFSVFVINAVAAFKPQWRYGVVAAVALSLGAESNAVETALDRSISIGLGVAVGVLTALIIWPDTAEKRAERHLRSALRAAANRLEIVVKSANAEADKDVDDEREQYHTSIENARQSAQAVRLADSESVKKRVEQVEKFHNSVLILERVGQKTDDAIFAAEDLRKLIADFRNCGCEIARALADEEGDAHEKLGALDDRLSSIKDAQKNGDGQDSILDEALVFGLHEVAESLRVFVEGSQPD